MNVVILKEKLDALANAIGIKAKRRVPQTIEELIETVDLIKSEPVLQSKTVTPAMSNQTITADGGYDGLGSVKVNGVKASLCEGNFQVVGTFNAYEPNPGYIGFSSVTIRAEEQYLPSSTSVYSSGTEICELNSSSGVRYLNIPAGFNTSSKHYKILPMASMTLPAGPVASSVGREYPAIDPSETIRFLNIPNGYNSMPAFYPINPVSSNYIGSSISRYNGEVHDEWITIYRGTTPSTNEWNVSNSMCSTYVRINDGIPVSFTSNSIYRIRVTIGNTTVTFQKPLKENVDMASTPNWLSERGWSIRFVSMSGGSGRYIHIRTGTTSNGGSGVLSNQTARVEAIV